MGDETETQNTAQRFSRPAYFLRCGRSLSTCSNGSRSPEADMRSRRPSRTASGKTQNAVGERLALLRRRKPYRRIKPSFPGE